MNNVGNTKYSCGNTEIKLLLPLSYNNGRKWPLA